MSDKQTNQFYRITRLTIIALIILFQGGLVSQGVLQSTIPERLTSSVGHFLPESFSASAQGTGPGGVDTDLAWWFKADSGLTTSGSAVTAWDDSSASSLDISQTTAASQPTTGNFMNFHPVVTFDGSNDYLRNAVGYWKASTSNQAYSIFAVVSSAQTSGVNSIYGENTNRGQQILFAPYNGNIESAFWSGYRSNTANIGELNTPYLYSTRFKHDVTAANRVHSISRNGAELTSNQTTIDFNGANSVLDIGGYQPSSWYYGGDIAEVMMYSADLSAADRAKVESYLALKYGISLTGDYVSSAGATIWDATANSSYQNDVTGIGADSASGLDQRQSISSSPDGIIAIGIGAVEPTNADNSNVLSDGQFLLWGNDDGSTDFNVNFSGGGFDSRMSRVWQVGNAGSVGATEFCVLNSSGVANRSHLITNPSDNSFAGGNTETPLSAKTINSQPYMCASGVTLADGSYFTIGGISTAPGGVGTNLQYWVRADGQLIDDGTQVTSWLDETGLQGDFDTPTGTPKLEENIFNYNPAVDFTPNEYLRYTNKRFILSATEGEIFYVLKNTDTPTADTGYPGQFAGTAASGYYDHSTRNVYDTFGSDTRRNWDTQNPPAGGPVRNVQDPHIYNVHSATNDWQAKFDGIVQFTSNSNTTNFSTQDGAHSYIGYNNNTYFNGSIAEILLFDRMLTTAERDQVNSALAIKYGITLGDNGIPLTYVDSGGATIWNNATYHNDVAGIGRDDSGALYQKQSRSVHDDTVLSIAIGTHADNNQAATGTFSNTRQFLMWGNDGGTPLLTEAFSSTTAADKRMNRVWQVANANSVGSVEVCVLSNRGTEFRSHLVVNASDNTFASGNTETELTPKVINSENHMCASGVTLSDGDYLTFAGIVTAPGGVGTNLQYWVRADGQIADDGTQVTSWVDETGLQGDFDFTTGTPKLEENIINFNPAVDFMPNEYLRYTSKRFILSATEGEIFYVLQNTDTPTADTGYPGQFAGTAASGYYDHSTRNVYDTFGSDTRRNWDTQNPPAGGPPRNAQDPHIYNVHSATNDWQAKFDGIVQFTTNSNTTNFSTQDNTHSYIGYNNNTYFNGSIAEILLFDRKLTDGERDQVNSALALKYGITFGANGVPKTYVDSSGATIWNNATYHNDVAGIGRDDSGALYQRQSGSVHPDSLVSIGLDSIAATNQTNTGTFNSDNQFLIWGHQGGVAGMTQAHSGSTFDRRFDRVWQVKNTNSTGAVEICVRNNTGLESRTHLLVNNSDPGFAPGTTTEHALSAKTVNGQDHMCVSGITLANDTFFTFGGIVTAPGAVAVDLELWLKADAGVTEAGGNAITEWVDQTSAHTPATYTGDPDLLDSGADLLNFNPVVEFDSDDLVSWTGDTFANSFTAGEMFVVGKEAEPDTTAHRTLAYFGGNGDPYYSYSAGRVYLTFGSSDRKVWIPKDTATAASEGLTGVTITGPDRLTTNYHILNEASAPNDWHGAFDGIIAAQDTVHTVSFAGASKVGDGDNSRIAEVLLYDRKLTNTERHQVNSALAIKYGITLGENGSPITYTNSAGTVIWDNSTYHNDVAGIGRDDSGALEQKQSRSINNESMVTIGLGAIDLSNAANVSTFSSDLQYLIWGHDGGVAGMTQSYASPSTTFDRRFDRVWQASNTNSVGAVEVCVWNNTGLESRTNLLVNASDPAFAPGTTTEHALSAKTINGQDHMCASGITLTDGDYFTFGGIVTAPGGVAVDLEFWLKADGQIVDSGVAVTNWTDETGTHGSFTAISSAPSFQENVFNFNPAVNFDGDDYFTYGGQMLIPTATDGEIFYVLRNNGASNTADGYPGQFGGSGSPTVHYDYSNAQIYDTFGSTVRYIWDPQAPVSGPAQNVRQPHVYNVYSAPNDWAASFDGLVNYESSSNTVNFASAHSPAIHVGAASSAVFKGDIAEVILYGRKLSATERLSVNSSLAIKYGITLGDPTVPLSYTNSGGTTIWDVTTHSTYHNDVAGIGRDDSSALDQRQSHSVNDSAILTIGLGEIVTSTAQHSTSFSADNQYLIWGHSGAETVGTGDALTTQVTDTGINAWMMRKWVAQETGSVDTTLIQFPVSAASNGLDPNVPLYLITADDSGFTTNVITNVVSLNGSIFEISHNFDGVTYFTFGQNLPDTDGDNIVDLNDVDDDNDGILDENEGHTCGVDLRTLTFNGSVPLTTPSASSMTVTGVNSWHTSYSDQPLTLPVHFEYLKADDNVAVMFGLHPTSASQVTTNWNDGGEKLYHGADGNVYGYITTNWNFTHNAVDGELYEIDIDETGYITFKIGGVIKHQSQGAASDYRLSVTSVAGHNAIISDVVLTDANTGQSSCTPTHTDADNIADHLDLDSDGDGIPDNIEAQTTAGFIAPSGTVSTTGEYQGLYDNYGTGFVPVDTDGDGTPDFMDLDSNDLAGADTFDASLVLDSADDDQDGLDNAIDTDDAGHGPVNAGITDVSATYPIIGNNVGWRFRPAPGGIAADLEIWLKADAGVLESGGNVSQWNNQSDAVDGPVTDIGTPVLNPASVNFNPAIAFDSDRMIFPLTGLNSVGTGDYDLFFVAQSNVTSDGTLYSMQACTAPIFQHFLSNQSYKHRTTSSPIDTVSANGYWDMLEGGRVSGQKRTFSNSNGTPLITSSTHDLTRSLAAVMGQRRVCGDAAPLNGQIAEVIAYTASVDAERNKIESYLALKYGLTLNNTQLMSYTTSTGVTTWDATANSAYHNDVAGIGFDLSTALDQRISGSTAPGGIVTVATTDDFTSANSDSSRISVNPDSFLIWGHNGLDATTWLTDTIASGYPSGKARLTREWLVQETGSVGPVSIGVQVDDATTDLPEVLGVLYLIVDSDADGDFSDEAAQRMVAQGGGLYTIANVDLSDGMKFTFGTAGGGVRGAVFQDNDTDGQIDADEPGVEGIIVTAVDASGTMTSTTTDPEGKFVFLNSGLEGETRITFELPGATTQGFFISMNNGPLDHLTSSVVGDNNTTAVQFAHVGDGWTVATAGFTPVDRPSPCPNPTVATVCYDNGLGSADPGWFSFPYQPGPSSYSAEAPSNQMGAVWGTAFDANIGQLYTGATLKRHVGLGPLADYNGTDTYTVDGVYVVQYSGGSGSFNPATPGFTLQGVNGIDLGTVQRHPDTNELLDDDYEIMASGASIDLDGFNKAGTVGFGNADVFNGELWLVNVHQGALIQVDTSGLPLNGGPAPAGNVTQHMIPDPGCSNGEFRPWALTFYNGLGFLGLVCSAETSQNTADLHAYIQTFNPSNIGDGFVNVIDFPLDYTREIAQDGGVWAGNAQNQGWFPWARTPADVQGSFAAKLSYPQAILSDIDFTADGNMVIGFMDRWGIQTTVTDPSPLTGANYTAITAGDLMYACQIGTNIWVMEGDTGCTAFSEPGGVQRLRNDGPFGGGEFFFGDTHMLCHGANLTFEDLTGSACVIGNNIIATNFGQFSEGGNVYTAGMRQFDATTGALTGYYGFPTTLPCVSAANGSEASLNNGVGELTCLCPALPVEIGNRVWIDYNLNGEQDPGEPPIQGVTVEILDAGNTVIGSAITDARGEYYFSSDSGTSTSNTKYNLPIPGAGVSVRIPNATGGSQQSPLDGLMLTLDNQGTNDEIDSDATMTGDNAVINVDTPGGTIDHTYDFGFAPDTWDIALRKTVPVQYAAPGDTVVFSIEVFNQVGGPMDNIALIDYVPAGLTVNDANWTPTTLTGPGTISRTLTAGAELPAEGLLPGQSVVVNVTMQIDGGLADNTVLTNKTEVSSVTDINGNPFTDRDSTPDSVDDDTVVDDIIDNTGGDEDDHDVAVVTVTAQTDVYDLALRKTTAQSVVSEGDDVLFTITVFNQGTSPANGIQLVDRYPAGFTLSPNEANWTDQGDGTATRTLTTLLAPGESINVSILLRAGTTLGTLQNYAEIKQDNGDDLDSQPEDDENDDNGDPLIDDITSDNGTNDEDDHDVAEVTVRRFDLALRKQPAATQAAVTAPGADVIFVIDVFNQGSVDAYDITIVDYLTDTLTLSENDTNGWIEGNPNQVINSIPGPLAPGSSERLTITLHVTDTAALGLMNNYAEIVQASDTPAAPPVEDADSTPDDGNGNDLLVDDEINNDGTTDEDDHDIASVTLGEFDLALTKVYTNDEGNPASGGNPTDAIIGVGERVTFTLEVTNQGDVTAYDIRVTDNSPKGLIIDDSSLEYNIARGWQVTSDQQGHFVFPGPLEPGESVSTHVVIFAVGPASPFYPVGGLVGTQTVWGEISFASYAPGGGSILDIDSIPDTDETNDPGGQPNSPADNYIDGNGTGTIGDGVAATDEDDHDPAQVTVVETFDLAIIKYPLVDAMGGNVLPVVEPGDIITYEYLIINQGVLDAQDITLIEHIPESLILADNNWTPTGPNTATRTHSNINLAPNQGYTDTIRFQINPAIAVSTIYTNIIEIADATGPGGDPNVVDIDSVPDTDGFNEMVIKDDFFTDNFLADPALFDEDDHDIAILMTQINDWGDNPDASVGQGTGDYGTLLADNGPRHLIVEGLHLGTLIDGEVDGIPTTDADGDNNDQINDEDGINLADLFFVEGNTATVRANATNTTTTPAVLYGFVDFNANGVFTDTGEFVTTTVPAGSLNVEFNLNFGTVPANGVTDSYARFRLSTDTGLDAQGVASDGEIEDYPVTISSVNANPSLALSKVYNGIGEVRTNEIISFTIRITNTGDVPLTTLPLEDRFSRAFLTYESATPAPDTVANSVLTWDDLLANDQDGLAVNESISVDVFFRTSTDTTLLPAIAPCTRSGETPNLARSIGARGSGVTVVTDGDDQDCDSVQIVNPTATLLAKGRLQQTPDGVLISWQIVDERNVAGFNIWHTDGISSERRNRQLILAPVIGQRDVGYEWLDVGAILGQDDIYVLEIVYEDGSSRREMIGVVQGVEIYLPLLSQQTSQTSAVNAQTAQNETDLSGKQTDNDLTRPEKIYMPVSP